LTNQTRPINDTPDIGMLRKEVDWVKEQNKIPFETREREWYQGNWWRSSLNKANTILHKKLLRGEIKDTTDYNQALQEEAKHCGTYACVAGHIALQYDPDYTGGEVNNNGVAVERVAREALGINSAEANLLFHGSNSADKIERVAQDIARRAGDRL
jgi:hypothetical protein